MSDDLVGRVLSAITEREQAAKDAAGDEHDHPAIGSLLPHESVAPGPQWESGGGGYVWVRGRRPPLLDACLWDERGGRKTSVFAAEHIAMHDPEAVLRLCQAHRDLIEEHSTKHVVSLDKATRYQPFDVCRTCCVGERQVVAPCPTLKIIARGYGIEDTP